MHRLKVVSIYMDVVASPDSVVSVLLQGSSQNKRESQRRRVLVPQERRTPPQLRMTQSLPFNVSYLLPSLLCTLPMIL